MSRFTCVMLLCVYSVAGLTAGAPSGAGLADPVIIPGSGLELFHGKAIALLRVFAVGADGLRAIPFQIDQRDSRGNWVWDVVSPRNKIGRYEYDNIGLVGPDWKRQRAGLATDDQDPEGQAVLDANDVLVFMAADLGGRASTSEPRFGAASAVVEIGVVDNEGTPRGWAYLAFYPAAPPALSELRYMHYFPGQHRIVSPVYEATFSEQHLCVLEQLKVNGVALLDRTRLRGEVHAGAGAVSWVFRFTENDIDGYVEGYIDGPVRIVRHTNATLRLSPLVTISDIRGEQFFYPQHSQVPVGLSLGFLTAKASLLLSADYHGGPFRRAFASGSGVAIELRDSASRHNLLRPGEGLSWLALDGDKASVVSVLTLPDQIRGHTELSGILRQDKTLSAPPEGYRGADPEAGYRVETRTGFPRGTHWLVGTYLYLPRPFAPSDAAQATRLAGSRLGVRIAALERTATHARELAGAAPPVRRAR
jgi:hypothetical protein